MEPTVYYGTKKIKATPMTREAYNIYRGWTLPEDEDGADDGYLVEYLDGGPANHPSHEGYISWSPKDVFEGHYQASGSMNFSHALQALKDGHRVARRGWNGKGMFIFLVKGSVDPAGTIPNFQEVDTRFYEIGDKDTTTRLPCIGIMTASGSILYCWLASQTDMLAEDWEIV